MFKKKIKPTKEMIQQSKLWENGKEDLSLVKQLYEEIIENARKKGFIGIFDIDDRVCLEECLCYVYDNEEHKRLSYEGKVDD